MIRPIGCATDLPIEEAWMRRPIADDLEELYGWCQRQAIINAHGSRAENAGKSMAFAKVMQRIREMQRGRE
jgi:hypothetical protein